MKDEERGTRERRDEGKEEQGKKAGKKSTYSPLIVPRSHRNINFRSVDCRQKSPREVTDGLDSVFYGKREGVGSDPHGSGFESVSVLPDGGLAFHERLKKKMSTRKEGGVKRVRGRAVRGVRECEGVRVRGE
jgi:hypothetical protein